MDKVVVPLTVSYLRSQELIIVSQLQLSAIKQIKFCQATCGIYLSANPADAQFISPFAEEPVLCLHFAILTNRSKKGSQGNHGRHFAFSLTLLFVSQRT